MFKTFRKLGAILSILAVFASPLVVNAATYFADTFIRVDSALGWGSPSDGSAAWGIVSAGTPAVTGISTNRGYNSSNTNGASDNYHTLSNHNNIVVKYDFITPSASLAGDYEHSGVYAGSAAWGPGTEYGVLLIYGSNSIEIRDNNVTRATQAFTFSTATTYHVEIDVDTNNWINAYVYTGAKPGTPTISFNNSLVPYTPTANGTNFKIGFTTSSAGSLTAYWSGLSIASPSTTDNALQAIIGAEF